MVFQSHFVVELVRLFDGRKDHSLDEKGRVSVPERYRSLLPGHELVLSQSPVRSRLGITAWPIKEWDEFLKRLDGLPMSHPVRQYLDDIVVSSKEHCTIDKNGRILIPQQLRIFSGLTNQARFIGRGQCFEIWAPDRHDAIVAGHRENASIDGELHLVGV